MIFFTLSIEAGKPFNRDSVGHILTYDLKHFYAQQRLYIYSVSINVAAIMAHTSIDQTLQNWYQREIRSGPTDQAAKIFKPFGNGRIWLPIYASSTLLGRFSFASKSGRYLYQWGNRCLRIIWIGGPPMLLLQRVLGSDRPTAGTSRWQPFKNAAGVSGHAFMGAVPFLSAASLVENPWSKILLYGLSTFTAISRVNDHKHYLSQILIGWQLAFIAARSISETERRRLTFFPLLINPSGVQLGFGLQLTGQLDQVSR